MNLKIAPCVVGALAVVLFLLEQAGAQLPPPAWITHLEQLSAKSVAEEAHKLGDAARGAVVFFQPQMSCSKCHIAGGQSDNSLGPDLTTLGKESSDESLVESVLHPSKLIRKGFESVTIATVDGNVLSALLVEQTPDRLVVRDATQNGKRMTFATEDIAELKRNPLSIMPAGQVNQLNSRQQFLDLIRYLIEIRDGGQRRALELQPPASLLAFSIPEYENHLDHAGLIRSWNDEALGRGEAIYQRVCANCHGTKDQPGSLPTSLRFAEGKFKNGSDPLSMYRTLTHGFGLMAAQSWMVPSQKYDVIHYIRETYLQPHNASQLSIVDDRYLAALPKGDTLGPPPSTIEPWSAMEYGPSLAHSFQVPGAKENFAYKGIAVRLDPGAGGVSRGRHWLLFDTDTLRAAAAWSATDAIPPTTGPGANAPAVAPKDSNDDIPKKNSNNKNSNNKNSNNKNSNNKNKNNKSPTHNNFIDWRAIQFNGEHGVHPRIVGAQAFSNSSGPGWANPASGSFNEELRVLGRDGKRYGPLPRDWGKFRGVYHHDQQVIFSYSIGNTPILESPRLFSRDDARQPPLILRTFHVGPRDRQLWLQVAELSASATALSVVRSNNQSVIQVGSATNRTLAGFVPASLAAEWTFDDQRLKLRIPAGKEPLRFSVWLPATETQSESKVVGASAQEVENRAKHAEAHAPDIEQLSGLSMPEAEADLSSLTHGGPPRWPQTIMTQAVIGADNGPFAADILTAPESNPWLALTRFTGLDFFDDGRIAICTWDGDVWIVQPSAAADATALRWQRIASGLFQPLGLKIVRGKIHLTCRDQLAVLHDLNGDGETDFYECLNNDHQVTEHFHEFAMGLQTDAAGNFYYAKSGCHGKPAVVPHHGTLLRVSPDGERTEILANGFRAANGVCLNPDGSFVVTDQEGFWNPKNRINWVTLSKDGQPNFYGNMLGYHNVTDTSDSAMVPPLCWITNEFDRSPAELLWVASPRWGALQGSLLNLSYGYGKVFLVPHERVRDQMQGGMIELPLPKFPTGVMRGRFHPLDGQLYLCGMFAWAGNATYPGGLYRLRATGQPMSLPVGLRATTTGIKLTFTEAIDPSSIDLKQISVKSWALQRTEKYGSKHLDEQIMTVRDARLSSDAKTLTLDVADLRATWCMEIKYVLRTQRGEVVPGTIHNTIHELSE